jgi:mRNA interferase MazF
MGFKRGQVRLAKLNPSRGSEPGKTRPCLIIQSDDLNDVEHPSSIILPLTSQVLANGTPLRFHLRKRDNIAVDSDILIDQIRAIDNGRFVGPILTVLTALELTDIDERLKILVGTLEG